jgi:hypothetical protein
MRFRRDLLAFRGVASLRAFREGVINGAQPCLDYQACG